MQAWVANVVVDAHVQRHLPAVIPQQLFQVSDQIALAKEVIEEHETEGGFIGDVKEKEKKEMALVRLLPFTVPL